MSISSIASSGMQVAALRQQVAASNVARQPVDGSPRQAVAASTQVNGGVAASVVDANADHRHRLAIWSKASRHATTSRPTPMRYGAPTKCWVACWMC